MGHAAASRIVAPALLVAVLLPAPAGAQTNYRALPLGGRSGILASTGVALPTDASAAFLNPAVFSLDDAIVGNVSVNLLRFVSASVSRWYEPGPVDRGRYPDFDINDKGLSRTAFSPMPSSLCIGLAIGGLTSGGGAADGAADRRPRLSLCYAVTDQSGVDLPAQSVTLDGGSFVTERGQTLRINVDRFVAGPSISFPLGQRFTAGLSLHLLNTGYGQFLSTTATTFDTTGRSALAGLDLARAGSSYEMAALLGATYRPGRAMTFGLAVTTPTVHLKGSFSGTAEYRLLVATASQSQLTSEKGDYTASVPLRIAAGAGYETARSRVEVDAFFTFASPEASRQAGTSHRVSWNSGAVTTGDGTFDRSVAANFTVNAAVGLEHFVRPTFSLLGGFYTDFSPYNLPVRRATLDDLLLFQTSRFAATFGASSHRSGGTLTLGGEVAVTWGKMAAPNAYSAPPGLDWVSTRGFQAMLIIAGSINERALRDAVDEVTSVVSGGGTTKK